MTIKTWHIEPEWQEPFVATLSQRGANRQIVGRSLAAIDDTLSRTGTTAAQEFGDPARYASGLTLSELEQRVSRIRATLLALAGLVGMFLALWGWTGVAQEVEKVGGMAPWAPVVIGLGIVAVIAIADTVLGRRADFIHADAGQRTRGGLALLLNRLAPWIILVLTVVGMVLIWFRWRD